MNKSTSKFNAALDLYTYICGRHVHRNITVSLLLPPELAKKIKVHYDEKISKKKTGKTTNLWKKEKVDEEWKKIKVMSVYFILKKLMPPLALAMDKCKEQIVKNTVIFHKTYPHFTDRNKKISTYDAALRSLMTRDDGMTHNDATVASNIGVTPKLTASERRDPKNIPSVPKQAATILNKNQLSLLYKLFHNLLYNLLYILLYNLL